MEPGSWSMQDLRYGARSSVTCGARAMRLLPELHCRSRRCTHPPDVFTTMPPVAADCVRVACQTPGHPASFASATASPTWKIAPCGARCVGWPLATGRASFAALELCRREIRHDCTKCIAWGGGCGPARRGDVRHGFLSRGGMLEPHVCGKRDRTAARNGRHQRTCRLAPRSRQSPRARLHTLVAGARPGHVLPQAGRLDLELRRQGPRLQQLRWAPDCIEGWGSKNRFPSFFAELASFAGPVFWPGPYSLYGSSRPIALTRRVSSAFDEIMSPAQGSRTKSLWTIRAGHSNIAAKSVRQSDMRCNKHPTKHYWERLRRPWLRQQQCALFPAQAGMQC